MRRSLAFLFAAAAACLSPALAGPLTRQPSGHWSAPVIVNGLGPFEFVVDTAASGSAVFPALRERLALKGAEQGRSQVHGASGVQSFELFPLQSLSLDGRRRDRLVAVGLNGIANDNVTGGIVGADLLSHYVAEFDFPAGQLRLHDPGTELAGNWGSVPFTLNRTRFVVLQGRLDGRPVTMILDTGARRTIVNWAAAEQAGVTKESDGFRPAESVGGATEHRTPALLRDFRSLSAGELDLGGQAITIAELPVFAQLGINGPAMILGLDRLRALRIAIDYPRGRLLFQRPRN